MFDRILTPLDGSTLAECVLPHVVAIARAFQSNVTLLRVADQTQGVDPAPSIDPIQWQIEKREANAYLEAIAARLHHAGVTVETTLLEGRAAERITEFAHHQNADLIIMSSHGRSGLSGWNISSIAQKVLLSPAASTLIVRAYQPTVTQVDSLQYRRLLVPLDGSLRAECVLPAATTLAQHYQAHMMIIHIISKPEMPRRTPLSEEDAQLAARIVERNREEMTAYFEKLHAQLSTPIETRLVDADNVSPALHDLSISEGADMVILSAHGYSANTMWPFGAIVTNFIAYGTTPLLIVQDVPPEPNQPNSTLQRASTTRPPSPVADSAPIRSPEN